MPFRGIYELRERVARGPVSGVFHAIDTRDRRAVVIAAVRRDGPRAEVRRRLDALVAEQDALSAVNELEDGTTDRRFPLLLGMERTDPAYLAVERVELPTLGQVLAGRMLDAREVVRVGIGAFTALATMHADGLAHRAIRPDTLHVREADGHVVIAGLGECRKAGEGEQAADVGAVATLLRLAGGGALPGDLGHVLEAGLSPSIEARPTAAQLAEALAGVAHGWVRGDRLASVRARGEAAREKLAPVAALDVELRAIEAGIEALAGEPAATFEAACAAADARLDKLEARLATQGTGGDADALADERARARTAVAERDAALLRERAAIAREQAAAEREQAANDREQAALRALAAAESDDPVVTDEVDNVEQMASLVAQRDAAMAERRAAVAALDEHRVALAAIEEQYRELAWREQQATRALDELRAGGGDAQAHDDVERARAEAQQARAAAEQARAAAEQARARVAALEQEKAQAAFADPPEAPARGGLSGLAIAAVGAALVAGIVFGGAGVAVIGPTMRSADVAAVSAPPPPPAPTPEAAPAPEAAPEAAQPEPVTSAASATPAAPATPAAAQPEPEARSPEPAAAAQPAAAPAKPSPKRLIDAGWKAIEGGDFDKARANFDKAYAAGGGGDALYGRGYANEKLGNSSQALSDYCSARATLKSADMKQEVEGTLRRLGASCP
jgi:hypothetical protein